LEDAVATEAALAEQEWTLPRRVAWWVTARRLLVRKPLGTFSLVVITLLVVAAVGAPFVGRYDPRETFQRANPLYNPNSFDPQALTATELDRQADPSATHWFGTDSSGQDTWSWIIWGARRSLGIGIGALAISVTTGTLIGVVSAYFSGWVDMLLQRLMDSLQVFPALLLLILMATYLGTSVQIFVLSLGIVGISQVSRIVRGTVLSVREMPYVEAARVLGASDLRTMIHHILPNTAAPIIIVFTIGLGTVILAEAGLSFLGLAPPGVSWGQALNEGRNFIRTSPWQAVFSGLAITMAVLAFNLAGDALRDVMDPRMRK
jgi:peptide/nickel transport system permease protein